MSDLHNVSGSSQRPDLPPISEKVPDSKAELVNQLARESLKERESTQTATGHSKGHEFSSGPKESVGIIRKMANVFKQLLLIFSSSKDIDSLSGAIHAKQGIASSGKIGVERARISEKVEIPDKETLKGQFIGNINKYTVNGSEGKDAIAQAMNEYLDSNAVKKLHQGCVESTTAREKFIIFLLDQKIFPANIIDQPPIKIGRLIGKEGEKLYREAIREEYNSKEFRSAVCLASSSKVGDTKADKAEVIVIIGPSASGKSSALDMVTKELFKSENEGAPKQNKLMVIDGGIEREQSQMAHLLLSFVGKQGYQGVEGLHEHGIMSKVPSIKKRIEDAIKTNQAKDINVVIPLTFAAEGAGRTDYMSRSLMWMRGGMKRYVDLAANTQRGICLVEVTGKDPKSFQNAVAVMGNKRAWVGMQSTAPEISLAGKSSCESKKYNSQFFSNGVAGSKAAATAFQELTAKDKDLSKNHFIIQNELVAYKPKEGGWEEVTDVSDAKNHSNSAVLTSPEVRALWDSLDTYSSKDKESLERFRNENKFQEFADYCRRNGIGGGMRMEQK